MEITQWSVPDRLAFFRELVSCNANVYSWSYSSDGDLIETNCDQLILHTIFDRTGCLAYAIEHAKASTAPLMLGAPLGVMWCVAYQTHEETCLIHVLGPVLNTEIPLKIIEESIRSFNADISWSSSFVQRIQKLPIVNTILLNQYVLQLHYCLTGEKLTISDIVYQQREKEHPDQRESVSRDRHQTYMAEQALLRCVREGDLNFRQAMANASSISTGVGIHTEQPMMRVYLSSSTLINLCMRAAIEGGLSPDTAYTVGDSYIQGVLNCKNIAEATALSYAMYEDFIRRVHRARTNPSLSRPIQNCCEYIELHPEEDLTLAKMARQTGYSESYLCRRFKQETGIGINNYIRFARVECARGLLTNTDLTIAEIAARLQFCSSTYFGNTFRKVMGVLPQKYRKDHKIS